MGEPIKPAPLPDEACAEPSATAAPQHDSHPWMRWISMAEMLQQLSTGGVAIMTSTACTHPIDVVKLRQQMEHVGARMPATNMVRTGIAMVRTEGAASLYRGLSPALLRAMTYGSLRLGLYEPCKTLLSPERSRQSGTALPLKILAGALAGSAATACTSPLELVKVRLQARDSDGCTRTSFGVVREILAREGVRGLWKGVGPSMGRASALTAAQCATYDESKQLLMGQLALQDGFWLHLSASMVTGVTATVASAPFDMVKTRMMVRRQQGGASEGRAVYRSAWHCAYKILHTEGVGGLYKGWAAMYTRLGPQTAITFIVYEKMRQLVGMSGL